MAEQLKNPSNRDTEAAWRYHNDTKHSWQSINNDTHHLDWSNQPSPFKLYTNLEGEKLPTDLPSNGVSALTALARPSNSEEESLPTLRDLAALLYYSAGITKRGVVPGGQMYFRAAACTGALYHIELYLVCGDLPDLAAGVYHFGPPDFSLHTLRDGDYRGVLVEATGGEPSIAQAPAVMLTTSVYWRNSWKYRDRAYRHAYWDSGTILANLLAVGNANKVPLKVVTSFVDSRVNRLLDVDDQREVALQLVPVGKAPGQSIPSAPKMPPLNLDVAPYSHHEVDYRAIREMHAASSLTWTEEPQDLRTGFTPINDCLEPQGQLFPMEEVSEADLPSDAIESVIL